MSFIISTHDLTKQYKKFTAVDRVSIHVEKGAVYGLIGRNGAGKTTILKILSGLALPTSGEVIYEKIDGRRPRIGALIEEPGLYGNLSAKKNLEIKRLACGSKNEHEADELLAFVGLSQWAGVKAGSFSLGMKQRLGIAMALVGDPDILILDEPINGLDPQGIKDVRIMLKKLTEEQHKTIIISSHLLEELSKIATVYGVLDSGRLVNEASEEEIMSRMPGYVRLIVDPIDTAKEVLNSMGIFSYQTKSQHMLHVLEQIDRREEMIEKMILAGAHISECQVIRETLEDYYINITREDAHHA